MMFPYLRYTVALPTGFEADASFSLFLEHLFAPQITFTETMKAMLYSLVSYI